MGIFPSIGQWSQQQLSNWIIERFPQLAFSTPAQAVRTTIPGEMRMWPTGTGPAGFLLCDGTAYDSGDDTYVPLYGILGTTFNTGGEAAGYFRVPDLRGRAPIGAGAGTGLTARTLGVTVGAETHVLAEAELPLHVHDFFGVTVPGTHGILSNGGAQLGIDFDTFGHTSDVIPLTETTSIGADDPHNNMQPSLAIHFIIAL
jgi:microcystin-dependent protein